MTADDLREALKTGRIDVAILDSVFGLESFRHRELLHTDMVVIAPPDSTETTSPISSPAMRSARRARAPASAMPPWPSATSAPNRRFRSQDITAADSLPVIVDLVANHGYVSFLGRVSAMPIADRVRIVDLARTFADAYHVAFNHRKASADACVMIAEAVRKIVAEPVAKTVAVA